MDGKSCVTGGDEDWSFVRKPSRSEVGGDEDWSFVRKPSRSEVGSSLEVSQKSWVQAMMTASWISKQSFKSQMAILTSRR